MSKTDRTKYERIDLNLFRVFDAVMTHRSVAGASQELGVTASAVSHALSRLRKLLDDELFVPSPDGMFPTPRAAGFAPNIRDALASISGALNSRPFDAIKAVRTFGIAASDFSAGLIVPRLLRRILARAPSASLQIVPLGRLDIVRQLDEGRLDVVLGWFDSLPERVRRRTLLQEQEAMVVRAGHPLAGQPVTRPKLFAYPHVVVDFTGTEGQAEDGFFNDRGLLRRVWIERLLVETSGKGRRLVGRVAATVPTYGLVAPIVNATDMIATLPERLARESVKRDRLVMLDLPYTPLSVAVEMVWHERVESDAGARWLLDQVIEAGDEAQNAGQTEC